VHVLDLSTPLVRPLPEGIPNGSTRRSPSGASDPGAGRLRAFRGCLREELDARLAARSDCRRGEVVRTFTLPKRDLGAVRRAVVSVPRRRTHASSGRGPDVGRRAWPGEGADGGARSLRWEEGRTVTFKLHLDGQPAPAWTKLRVYLGGTSTVQNVANLLYLKLVPDESQLTVPR